MARIAGALAPYVRRHRPLLAGSMGALLAGVALKALEPWPLKLVFDRVLMPRDGAATAWDPLVFVALCAAALVLINSGRAGATYLTKVGFALVGTRVTGAVRGRLFRHVQCLSLGFHARARTGDLIVRVIRDIGMLREVAVTALMPLVGNVLLLVGMGALMLWLHWKLALVALATLPLYWLPTVRQGRRIRDASRKQRQREGAMASTATESIAGMDVVQALGLEDTFADAFSRQNRKSLKQGVTVSRHAARLQGSVLVLVAVSTGLTLLYGSHLVLQGELTPGDLLVFLAYLKAAFRPVQDFAKYAARLARATAAGERVVELLEERPEIRDAPNAVPAPPLRGALCFEDVHHAYDGGPPVLDGLRAEVQPGETLAVVGASGAGKSTLVKLVPRLLEATAGRVLVDGRDVRTYTLESLRAQVSVLPQETLLFAATVHDNIAYGDPEAGVDRVRAAAREANAAGFIEALPEGWDTMVGEKGATLSAGQRQRIAVARALVRGAPIVILDEPGTGLDEENQRAVTEALGRLTRGRTTLLVTHDLGRAATADRILYLEHGRAAELGTHQELMARGGRYAELVALGATDLDADADAQTEGPRA
jgi:ATP-binding cassette subfamily B protein